MPSSVSIPASACYFLETDRDMVLLPAKQELESLLKALCELFPCKLSVSGCERSWEWENISVAS